MQSEFLRLVHQVERLEQMHRAGLTYTPDVDELFAIARECRKTLDVDEARAEGLPPPVFTGTDPYEIAAQVEAAVEEALLKVVTRLAPRPGPARMADALGARGQRTVAVGAGV